MSAATRPSIVFARPGARVRVAVRGRLEQVAARDAVIMPPTVVGAWGTRPSVDP